MAMPSGEAGLAYESKHCELWNAGEWPSGSPPLAHHHSG
jgi:hypothetical protein